MRTHIKGRATEQRQARTGNALLLLCVMPAVLMIASAVLARIMVTLRTPTLELFPRLGVALIFHMSHFGCLYVLLLVVVGVVAYSLLTKELRRDSTEAQHKRAIWIILASFGMVTLCTFSVVLFAFIIHYTPIG